MEPFITSQSIFIYRNHTCLILGTRFGSYNGYADVPKDSIFFGKEHSDLIPGLPKLDENSSIDPIISPITTLLAAITVNRPDNPTNRLDFLISVHGGITFSGYLEGQKDKWFFGFDCSHAGDWTKINPEGTFRNFFYVKSEIERMVDQLIALEEKQND